MIKAVFQNFEAMDRGPRGCPRPPGKLLRALNFIVASLLHVAHGRLLRGEGVCSGDEELGGLVHFARRRIAAHLVSRKK